MGNPINSLKLLFDRSRPKIPSAKTTMHIIIITGDDVNSSASSAVRTSTTLVVSAMMVMVVMMNYIGFLLVSLTGFVICRVIGVHLVGSVVSCFLVHKEILVGP